MFLFIRIVVWRVVWRSCNNKVLSAHRCRNGWTSVVSQSGLRLFDCLDLDGKDAPDLVPVYVHTAAADLLPARASSLSAEAAWKICPSCGKEQKQGSTFCAGCII